MVPPMPWNPVSLSAQRESFVLLALRATQPFSCLCRDAGISRKTGYKWLIRYHHGGTAALQDVSRRPRRLSRQKAPCWQQRVVSLRQARPRWGPKKIRQCLRQLHPRVQLPAVRTIARWLQQLSLAGRQPRRARKGPSVPHPGLTIPRRVHQVWTVDFKGWFRTTDGQRQEPLTIREAKSRYVLDIRLLPNQSDAAVRRAMTRVFRREGLPTAIRVDNGAPFGGCGALGLSRLSVWWLRLGIRVEFTRRARPGDNAAHEQLHACYKAEVLSDPASCRKTQQQRSDHWREDYNHQRPHEALAQRTPAQCYRPSSRTMPRSLPPPCAPSKATLLLVRPQGSVKWQGRLRFIGRAFAGQVIALQAAGTHHTVHFGKLLIGHLHPKDPAGMRPAHWKRQPQQPLKV
jgi:putative transposase